MTAGGDRGTHWATWHQDYADPTSPLSERLGVVVSRIRQAVDVLEPGPISVISACAGQGHDVVLALQDHPRASDVSGSLVEWDEHNVNQATAALRASGLHGITAIRADASDTDAYRDMPRDDLLLLCGIREWFGEAGLEEVSFESPGENSFSVGMNRLLDPPAPTVPGLKLFTFLR